MPLPQNINDIISEFAIAGEIATILILGSGRVNDTYHLQNSDPKAPDYLLQRINHQMFRNVPGLMENIARVTEHIKTKLPGTQAEAHSLTIIKLHDGDLYHKDHYGNYWRMLHFIKGAKSYHKVTNINQAYEGGKALGKFQAMLADLDTELLHHTIPGLHDIVYRLDHLEEAYNNNLAGRAGELSEEFEFINRREEAMCRIIQLGDADELPWRITHNDPKFNVLLDEYDHAQCMIDLDTVMPGYVAYDFGEAIRTMINTAAEDEADPAKIDLDIPLFEAYTKGYFEAAGAFLTPMEVQSLMMGVMLMPFIRLVRFLTNYLNGDIDYKVDHPAHNLQRARAQMQLIYKLEQHEQTLHDIIERVASRR